MVNQIPTVSNVPTRKRSDVPMFQRSVFSRIPDGSGLAVADSRLLAFHQLPACLDLGGVTNHESLFLQSNVGTALRSFRRRCK